MCRVSSFRRSRGCNTLNPGRFRDHPQVLMDNVPVIHVEFDVLPPVVVFDDRSCQVFGSNSTKIAAKFSLAQSGSTTPQAGIFICTDGTSNGECQTTTPTPNIITAFYFYERQGTILSAKSNLTIIDVTSLTQSQPISFSASDFEVYQSVRSWLLDYSAANIPAPSSIIENFWSAGNQLQYDYATAFLQRNFRSILVFPLWLLNNYGNAGQQDRVMQNDLPPQFYTTASLVQSFVKIKFNQALLFIFVAFQDLALLLAWAILF